MPVATSLIKTQKQPDEKFLCCYELLTELHFDVLKQRNKQPRTTVRQTGYVGQNHRPRIFPAMTKKRELLPYLVLAGCFVVRGSWITSIST
jgi:hypothetical protein